MNIPDHKKYSSHGEGSFQITDLKTVGENVVIEKHVLVFHPENISLGNNVYIGHSTILKGYYKNELIIGDNTWIGQGCFFHSAGGIVIGRTVGIGPKVNILTSYHKDENPEVPVMVNELVFSPVIIGDGCDLGVGSTILPGIRVGEGSIIGAASVVTHDVDPYTVVAGNPAKVIRKRR